jgi:hypothetical protein
MFQSGHRLETLKRDDWLQLHGVPSHASMSIYARVAALSGSDSDDGADGGVVKISRRLGTFSRPRGVRRQQRPEADRWWTRIAVSLQTVPPRRSCNKGKPSPNPCRARSVPIAPVESQVGPADLRNNPNTQPRTIPMAL